MLFVLGFGSLWEKCAYRIVRSLQRECFLSQPLVLSLYFVCTHTQVLRMRGTTLYLSKPFTTLKLKITFWVSNSVL